MTNYEAIVADLSPFTCEVTTVEKVMIDQDVDIEGTYSKDLKKDCALCTLELLKQMACLSSEQEGDFRQVYDPAAIQARIKAIANDNGINPTPYLTGPTISNGSNRW